MKPKVLVTGATGFIGKQSLTPLIRRGYEVHGVGFGPQPHPEISDVIWHEANLLDPVATENLLIKVKPTHLLHFAWYVEHGKYLMSEENHIWVKASTHLAKTFAQHGGKRFVGAGSCFEYDWSQGRCSEISTPLKPRGIYGEAKNYFHQNLQEIAKKSLESYGWGRIFFLYGTDEPPRRLVPLVIEALKNNKPLPPTPSKRARDFLCVEDVGDAFAALLDSQVVGAVNIASGVTHTLKEVVFCIADLLKQPQPSINEAPNNPATDEPEILSADVTRLHDELHWKPQFNLRQGLQKSLGQKAPADF